MYYTRVDSSNGSSADVGHVELPPVVEEQPGEYVYVHIYIYIYIYIYTGFLDWIIP